MSIENQLASIRQRLQTAQQREAKADVLRERSLQEKDAALASLKSEFDVDSFDEAELLLKRLTSALEEEVSGLEKTLDSLGA